MPYSDEDIRNTLKFAGDLIQQSRNETQALRKEFEAYKGEAARERVSASFAGDEAWMTDHGYSAADIQETYAEAARRPLGLRDYVALGYAPEPRLVIGGMDPDDMKHAWENPFDESFWDRHRRKVRGA
jgi:hypothetical protein